MRHSRLFPAAFAAHLAVLTVAPLPAHADTKSAAQKLFDEGAALMAKKDFASACPKIKASMDLEPTDGTVLRLAVCYQGLGQWSSAWGLFKESVSRAERATPPRKDRIDMAKKGIVDVEKRLSYLTIEVKTGSRPTGFDLRLDGEKIVEAMFGIAMPIDPGSHTLSASAPGRKGWEASFSIGASAEKKNIEVPGLEEVAAAQAPPPPAVVTTPAPPTKASGGIAPHQEGTPTLAYVSVGAGVLFLGGAVLARLKMGSELDDYRARCASQLTVVCDDPDGRSRVRTWETMSWVSGGVGLAAVGVGVALIVSTPRTEKKSAIVAAPTSLAGGLGLVVSGTF